MNERLIALLDQATMRVSEFGNPAVRVVRRDEAEAIVRQALEWSAASAVKILEAQRCGRSALDATLNLCINQIKSTAAEGA